MQLTKNFNLKEFQCKSGAEMPKDVLENIKILAENMQVLRDHIDRPIKITSGYRSPEHTKNLIKKGVKTSIYSQHVLGKAADFKVEGLTPATVIKDIEVLIMTNQMLEGGIGIYPTWVHYDIRGIKARW